MQAMTQNYLKSYINNNPLARTKLSARQIIYNDHIRTPDELHQLIRDCKLWQYGVTEKDISFLTELYNRKEQAKIWHSSGWLVPSEVLVDIFIDFCRHFGIEKFRSRKSYVRIITKESLRRARSRVLFILLPLTKGEYTTVLKRGIEMGKLSRERLNNGRCRRYIYYVNGGDGHGQH